MKRPIRKLNKYERAYVKKMQRTYRNRMNLHERMSFGKKIILLFYFLRKKITSSINKISFYLQQKKDIFKKPLVFELDESREIKETQEFQENNQLDESSNLPKGKNTQGIKHIHRVKKQTEQKKTICSSLGVYIANIMSDIKKKKKIKKRVLKKTHKPKNHKPRKKRKIIFSLLKWMIGLGIIVLLILAGMAFLWVSSLEIPDVNNFEKRKISNSTKIYDRTGEILLYDIHEDIQRTVVSGDKISQHAKNAIIAIEDHSFYQHDGVVWKSTFRAIFFSVLSKIGLSDVGFAGGSTLTQQMIKNTLLTRERTLTRKVKEWVLAYKIEKKLTKDQILATYLNEAPYGGTIYGIQEASRVFFGKPASDLTIAESAYLASIPNLPTYFSPYGPNKDKLDRRQRIVLSEMKKYNYISDSEYRAALQEKVEFISRKENNAKALHFVHYVRAELEKRYGVDVVENEGLKVITTLDYKLQQKAEKIIKNHVEEVKSLDASNAALVAVESQTGNIITMVGSRDYFDTDEFDGNFNVAISPRQPGSSFKPFAYATAFEKGYLPESIIFDTPTQFSARCQPDELTTKKGCYAPNNWDNKFNGKLSFRDALAQSRNIPAVKVLYLAGIPEVIKKAQEMGISSLTQQASHYGLGLVLGGGEVSLLEMVSAYTTFANDGKHNKINAILSVADIDGNILDQYRGEQKRVFSKNTARMISSILSDNIARTPLYGSQSLIYFGQKAVAGKTGTTNDKRDAWMVGYTSDVAVGVWTGNNDNSPMKKGSKISMKPWREFMEEIIDEYNEDAFKDYDLPDNFAELPNMIRGEWFGGKTYTINSVSGKLANEFTPDAVKMEITNFNPHTILHSVNKNKPQEAGNSQSDSQYKNWEFSVQDYASKNYTHLYGPNFVPPTEYDDEQSAILIAPEDPLSQSSFDFTINTNRNIFDMNEPVKVKIDLHNLGEEYVQSVVVRVNNNILYGTEHKKLKFDFIPESLLSVDKLNTLEVTIIDKDNNRKKHKEIFKLNIPDNFVSMIPQESLDSAAQ